MCVYACAPRSSAWAGAYLLDGRVCTDATAQALDAVLGKLDTKHNPQVFVQTLAATGKVKATRFYNKTPERGAPAVPSGPPGPPDFHGRPTR